MADLKLAKRMGGRIEELELTQAQVGEACGVSQQTVSYWLKAQRIPSQGHMRLLCKLLELPLDELEALRKAAERRHRNRQRAARKARDPERVAIGELAHDEAAA